MPKKVKKYVLITPTYNEADNIEKTVKVVINSFPKDINKDFHVLVVDGNSPDGTADIVRGMISKYSNVHLLLEKAKKGLGAAYLQAMDYAFDEMKADYVFQFDADLSHDPSKIKDFVNLSDKGYDFVTGTRYKDDGGIPDDWGWHRKIISRGGNAFVRLLFYPTTLTDWTSGYSMISKKVYKKVKGQVSLEKGYNFMISLKKAVINNGFDIGQIPYKFKDRELGDSKIGPEYLFRALFFVTTTRIKELVKSSFFKVCLVGGVGFLIQTVFFVLFFEQMKLRSDFSQAFSAELAIISNYILNNNFSFKAQKISGASTQFKAFGKFNLISLGSILIQFLTQYVGITFFGNGRLTIYVFYILGILLGLMSNFYFYKTLVWKAKK